VSRLYFVAGERSGDMHAAHLIEALRAREPAVACEGLGGKLMAAAGLDLHYDLAGDAIMGFTEVIKHLPQMRRLLHETINRLRASPPDCLVLVDYPGFNMRLAKAVQDLKIPIVYYISPQVWAWKKKRRFTLAELVGKMLVIFPFEEKLFWDIGMDCTFVGHPLIDSIPPKSDQEDKGGALRIGVLPGSRAQEIDRLLTPMLDICRELKERYPEAQFVTSSVNAARAVQIKNIVGDFPLEVLVDDAEQVMSSSRFCLVASGTATLETALHGTPMVIMYRVGALTYRMARWLVDVEHIGMVNILADARIVPEFIQEEATVDNILPVACDLIGDTPARQRMLEDFTKVRATLGAGGASERAAEEILSFMGSTAA
jgi:lipid-A-disaccharide synthase